VFLGPALLPGKTLSNSDVLWFEPPFVTAKPASLTTPSNPELGDAVTQLQPFLHHTARELPHIPLWAPWIMSGRPFQANSQSAVFGPYSWPAYVLPFWTALGWIGVLKLWVASFGTYLLGRALGMRFGGALLAGIVFAFSLKMVTWLSYPHMSVWTFIPWLWLLSDRLIRRPTALTGAGLAVVVALQFLSGHAESSFQALLATTAFMILRLWQLHRARQADTPPALRSLSAFGAALVAGTALAAISLVPFLELLWHSADLHARGGAPVYLLERKEAIGIFLPDWWGRPTQTPIRLFVIERALYVGALPLMLTGAALVIRPTVERVAIALAGLLVLVVVLGVPPSAEVVSHQPVFRSGHNTRLIIFSMLAAALLAGWGFDELSSERTERRRAVVLGIGAVLLMLPLVVGAALQHPTLGALRRGFEIAWLFHQPPGAFRYPIGVDAIRMSALIMWLTLAGAGLLLIFLRLRGRLTPVPFMALGVLLVCIDLFRAGMGFNPAIDRDHAELRPTGAIEYLQRQRPARFASTEEIPQNILGFEFGLYDASGYDLPVLERYDRLWRGDVAPEAKSVAAGIENTALELRNVTPGALRVLGRLGVTDLLRAKYVQAVPPDQGLKPVPPLTTPGLEQVYDGPDARVYRVDGALPRAFVVGAQRVVEDDEAARRAFVSPGFDPLREAITEERIAGVPRRSQSSRGSGGARPGLSSARILSYEPERVVVRARSDGSGLLVLGDNWSPGWKAEVDGRAASIERVDYLYRGVRLGPGQHRVEFSYEPLSWRIGWIASLVSLVALALVVLVAWRRRRAERAP
jgi:hypothetical protein